MLMLRLFLKTGTGVPCPYNFVVSGDLEARRAPRHARLADGRAFGAQHAAPLRRLARGHRWAFAATAPARAPMASHLALRATRRRTLPPLAAWTAWSRSWVRTTVLARSSVRSAWVAANLAWQALQSMAKS